MELHEVNDNCWIVVILKLLADKRWPPFDIIVQGGSLTVTGTSEFARLRA